MRNTTTWRRRAAGAALSAAVSLGVVGAVAPTASAQECLAQPGTVAVVGAGYACRIFVVPFFPAVTSLPAGTPIPDGVVPARLLGPGEPYPDWRVDGELRTVWFQVAPSQPIQMYAPTELSRPRDLPSYAVPDAPTGVTAVPGDEQVTLSWTPPTADGGSPVDRYVVTEFQDGVEHGTRHLDDAATSIVWDNLTNGRQYGFTVRAWNVRGQGEASAPSAPVVPARLPGAPMVGYKAGDSAVTVNVFPLTGYYDTGGLPIASYTVRVFSSGTLVKAVTVPGAGVPPQGRPVVVAALVNGRPYTGDAVGTTAFGTGPSRGQMGPVTPQVPMKRPAAPAIRTSRPGPIAGGLSVRWTLPPKSATAPVRYVTVKLYAGGKLLRTTQPIIPTQGTLTFLGLDPKKKYSFTVTTHNEVGASAASKRSVPAKPMPGKVRPR